MTVARGFETGGSGGRGSNRQAEEVDHRTCCELVRTSCGLEPVPGAEAWVSVTKEDPGEDCVEVDMDMAWDTIF